MLIGSLTWLNLKCRIVERTTFGQKQSSGDCCESSLHL